MELKGSKTEQNLRTAFAGESQAHTKYLYYSSKAAKDGYVQIGKLFEETAKNEKEHAKIWFKLLHGGEMPSTEENLLDAANIAFLFEGVGAIEKAHEERYRKLLENDTEGVVFSSEEDAIWECSNCGHIVIGKKAPELCPVCKHPQKYFQLKAENY